MDTLSSARKRTSPREPTSKHTKHAVGGVPATTPTLSTAPAPAPRPEPAPPVPEARRHTRESVAHAAAVPSPSRATFLRSFVYAFNGLVYALRTQRNARIHACIGTMAIILGIVLHISPVEFAMLFVAITGVFIAEMFNTVAEACVDLATQEYHPLARIAKDVAAGAVLVNAMLSVIIGLFIFGPHLWPLVLHLFEH